MSLTYKFSVTGPTSSAQKVFVHVLNQAGTIMLADDHLPPTTAWANTAQSPIPDISYSRSLNIPSNFPYGEYRIVGGLYFPSTGVRLALTSGNRVSELGTGTRRYLAGNLTVTPRQIVKASFSCPNSIYSDPAGWTGDVTGAFKQQLDWTTWARRWRGPCCAWRSR